MSQCSGVRPRGSGHPPFLLPRQTLDRRQLQNVSRRGRKEHQGCISKQNRRLSIKKISASCLVCDARDEGNEDQNEHGLCQEG